MLFNFSFEVEFFSLLFIFPALVLMLINYLVNTAWLIISRLHRSLFIFYWNRKELMASTSQHSTLKCFCAPTCMCLSVQHSQWSLAELTVPSGSRGLVFQRLQGKVWWSRLLWHAREGHELCLENSIFTCQLLCQCVIQQTTAYQNLKDLLNSLKGSTYSGSLPTFWIRLVR